MPLALTPKSVCGSDAAQSCDGCAAVWMTAARSAPTRSNSAQDAVGVADVELHGAELAAELAPAGACVVRAVEASGPKKRARMSFSMPTTS